MIWQSAIRPLLFMMPAESVHYASMNGFSVLHALPFTGTLFRSQCDVKDRRLQQEVFGLPFSNPVGLAAGFDKNARWIRQLSSLGFGHIEVGTITGQGQDGNPKPRLFRLPKDSALLNRMGFNNAGSESAAARLQKLNRSGVQSCLGINIGKTKVVPIEQAADDYLLSFRRLYSFADYFTINVSSPNTPGLRKLQDREPLENLIGKISQLNAELGAGKPKPVLLKIAPDLTDEQIDEIAEIALASGLSGVIATNTTISRDELQTSAEYVQQLGAGGVSGGPLTDRSPDVVRRLYQKLQNKIPIIGVGGIMKPEDAWNMITAGASLVQVYTGFIYGGPKFASRINRYLVQQMESRKIANIRDVIGMES